jgi:hypothetical protein
MVGRTALLLSAARQDQKGEALTARGLVLLATAVAIVTAGLAMFHVVVLHGATLLP